MIADGAAVEINVGQTSDVPCKIDEWYLTCLAYISIVGVWRTMAAQPML